MNVYCFYQKQKHIAALDSCVALTGICPGLAVISTKFYWLSLGFKINPSHKSHDESNKYPTMCQFVTEMWTCAHISVTKYGTGALWDLLHSFFYCSLVTPYGILVNIGNGLSPLGAKPLREPMLTYCLLPIGSNTSAFKNILCDILKFSFKEMHLKMWSAKL